MGIGRGGRETGAGVTRLVGVTKTSGVRDGVGLRKGNGGKVGVGLPLKSRPQPVNINNSNVESQAA